LSTLGVGVFAIASGRKPSTKIIKTFGFGGS
jgi:hypothetical protein